MSVRIRHRDAGSLFFPALRKCCRTRREDTDVSGAKQPPTPAARKYHSTLSQQFSIRRRGVTPAKAGVQGSSGPGFLPLRRDDGELTAASRPGGLHTGRTATHPPATRGTRLHLEFPALSTLGPAHWKPGQPSPVSLCVMSFRADSGHSWLSAVSAMIGADSSRRNLCHAGVGDVLQRSARAI